MVLQDRGGGGVGGVQADLFYMSVYKGNVMSAPMAERSEA